MEAKSAGWSGRPGSALCPSLRRSLVLGSLATLWDDRSCVLPARRPQFAISTSALLDRWAAAACASSTRRIQVVQRADRELALVRDLRSQESGEETDGAGRQCGRSRRAHYHGSVHRHRQISRNLAEHLSTPETAAFLNDHFRLLAICVEAEGGTIDKFIGDSLMAFWGAPDAQLDHAARACRAARAIAAADRMRTIAIDASKGVKPVRIRVAIHTGPTIVGNIGAPGRINYTIIGDTVNIAQRIENIAKEHMTADDEVVVLVSEVVLKFAGPSLGSDPPLRSIHVEGAARATESSSCYDLWPRNSRANQTIELTACFQKPPVYTWSFLRQALAGRVGCRKFPNCLHGLPWPMAAP